MKTLNKSALALVFAAMALPAQAEIELAGDKLAIYGKLDLSFDYMESDVSKAQANASDNDRLVDSSFGVSSNSSRIGFRGAYPVNDDWTATYQLEQEARYDSGGNGFATRNSYLGLKTDGFGEVRAGRHDTPFKKVATGFDELGNTVGDNRAILGAAATSGNEMNLRADNALMYLNGFDLGGSTLKVTGLFSADGENSSGSGPDDNSHRVFSAGASWLLGPLTLSGAVEDARNLVASGGEGDAQGIRLAAEFTFGDFLAGMLLESLRHDLDSGADSSLERNAFGLKVGYEGGPNKLVAQFSAADDADSDSNSSAYMASVGGFRNLGGGLKAYAVLTRTSNDDNAAYQGVDGGHGDELGTVPGGAPIAVSLGAQLSF